MAYKEVLEVTHLSASSEKIDTRLMVKRRSKLQTFSVLSLRLL